MNTIGRQKKETEVSKMSRNGLLTLRQGRRNWVEGLEPSNPQK